MALSKRAKKLLTGTLVGLSAGAVIAFGTRFFLYDLFEGMERNTYDFRYLWKYVLDPTQKREAIDSSVNVEVKKPIDAITIVDIDERSMAKLGPFHKWPRSYHGQVVENLAKGGASAIVFDIMFKTADFGRNQTEEVLKILNQADTEADWSLYEAAIRTGLNYDSVMIEKIADTDVTIGAALMNNKDAYPNKSDWEDLATLEWQRRIKPQSAAVFPSSLAESFETKPILDNIFPEFAQACARLGLVNVVPDEDGTHRRLPLFFNYPDPEITPTDTLFTYSTIAIQTALHLLGKQLDEVDIVPGKHANLGAPLRIYRKNGMLRSSYPNFTVPMIQQMMRKSDALRALGPENPTTVHISTPVVLKSIAPDEFEVDILEGGFLTNSMYQAISALPPDLQWLDEVTGEAGIQIGHTILLGPTKDAGRYLVYDSETEDEATVDRYTLDVLLNHRPAEKVAALQPGETLLLSGHLDIAFDAYRNRYTTPIAILTKDVIHSIAGYEADKLGDLAEGKQLRFGRDISIPLDERGRMLINYRGRSHQAFRYISYYDVMAGRLDPTYYQGKTFLLGSSAASMFDIVSSPFEEEYPGVEIHATLLGNILQNDFMRRLGGNETLAMVVALGLIIGLATYFLPLLWSILLTTVAAVGYFALSIHFFDQGLWIEVARPEITIFLTFLSVMVARYMVEEKDKKFLNDAFKNYISPELIDIMIESGQRPELGGKEDVLSAYFTDIQGFSTFSEKLGSPTKLVELLNEYLSEMTDILLESRGTLDKYEGDAIIAFFGAPMRLDDHALSACLAALKMQDRLALLREKWRSEGDKWPKIVHDMRMRVGINSGSIVTGNMGSRMRMNYTMMGDAVNLAARLESGAKQYGVYSMASEDTIKLVNGALLKRELDTIRVVGKTQPVKIYELVARTDAASSEAKKCVELYHEAKGLYQKQNWDGAIEVFRQSLELEPNHPRIAPGCKTTPSQVFIERCEQFKLSPPVPVGEEWDGVYTATEK